MDILPKNDAMKSTIFFLFLLHFSTIYFFYVDHLYMYIFIFCIFLDSTYTQKSQNLFENRGKLPPPIYHPIMSEKSVK